MSELLSTYQSITGFDLTDLLNRFISFVKVNYKDIANYYGGKVEKPNTDSFNMLNVLTDDFQQAIDLMYVNKNQFDNAVYWEMLDELEDMYTRLLTTSNLSKILRSSIHKGSYFPNLQSDYILRQNEKLEDISKGVLKSKDSQNEWSDIALYNDLIEEDYTPDGDVLLKLVFRNPSFVNIESVVDNIEGEKMYGLDIDRTITFEDDDLKVLSYKDTMRQAIDILSGLRQGDNPEFSEQGIKQNAIVGNNLKTVQFPSIARQLYKTFSTDDTISSFSITDLKIDQDAVLIEAEIQTRYGEVFNQDIKI